MTSLAGRWNRFWFREIDGLPFALVRVGLALTALQLWAGTLPLVRRYYSDAGEYPIADAGRWGSEWLTRFLMVDPLGSYPVTVLLFAAWGALLVALLAGWRLRWTAPAAWLLTAWFFFRNPTFANGGDEVLRLCLLYLALGYAVLPARDRALSLDRRRSGAAGGIAMMPAWPLRLVQLQICVVYLVAGFWKVVGPPWQDGSALYYALGNSAFSRFGVPEWPGLQPLFVALTLSVAWWEFLFPLLVTWERTRRGALLFGVLVHGTILVFMNIGIFSLVMLAVYPAFLKPEEARRIVARAGDRIAALYGRSAGPSRTNATASGASP